MRGFVRFCLLLFLLVAPRAARADEPAPTPTKKGEPLAWDWPRFQPAEIAFTGGMALNVAMAIFLYPAPKNNWDGPILWDNPLRDIMRLHSRDGRVAAGTISDYIYYSLAIYPLLDTGITGELVHHNHDVTLQMLAIDLESYALGGAVALGAEKVGRRRPMARACETNPSYDPKCGDNDNLNSSFLSGHTTIGFTGAGLLCAHHLNLPLYGGGPPDTVTCIAGMTLASVGGILRGMSDNHWSTDIMMGAGTGLFAGYFLPVLLHYGKKSTRRTSVLPTFDFPRAGVMGVVAPQLGPDQGGLQLTGMF